MATLWISEYPRPTPFGGSAPSGLEDGTVVEQTVSFTTSTQSAAFNSATRFVRLWADEDCHVAFGTDPTATAQSRPLAAKVAEYFGVVSNSNFKVAVYDGSS